MTSVLAMLMGAGVGLGLLLAVAGARGRRILPRLDRTPRHKASGTEPLASRLWAIAAGAGVVTWALTGWIGAGVGVLCAVAVVPRLFMGERERQAWIAKTEAIAAWTEMLRDTMAAADGVEEAITATVPIAPRPLRHHVALLDARRRNELALAEALTAFASDVDHPSADLVVTALTAAAEGEGSDFHGVLTRLAAITRSEVRMRHEIEAGRAQLHTASRIILGVLVVAVVGFLAMSSGYFEPYATWSGQVALVVVAALFSAGTLMLQRMSRIEVHERFTPRRNRRVSA